MSWWTECKERKKYHLMLAGFVCVDAALVLFRAHTRFILTEVLKYLTLVAVVLLLTEQETGKRQKLLRSLGLMLLNSAALVGISEYGNIAILWVVYLMLCTLVLPGRVTAAVVLIMTVLALGGLQVSKMVWTTVYPERNAEFILREEVWQAREASEKANRRDRESKKTAAREDLVKATEKLDCAVTEVKLANAVRELRALEGRSERTEQELLRQAELKSDIESMQKLLYVQRKAVAARAAENRGGEADAVEGWSSEAVSDPGGMTRFLAAIYQKFNQRFYDKDNMQVQAARRALIMAGPFGTEVPIYMFSIESDLIFNLVVGKLGAVMGVCVLAIYFLLMVECCKAAFAARRSWQRMMCIASGLCIVTQAYISAASAIGLFPIIGVGMPLLARGKSGQVIFCAFIFLTAILSASGEFAAARREKKGGIRYETMA